MTNFHDQEREDQVIEKLKFVKLEIKNDPIKSNHLSTNESEYTKASTEKKEII